MTQQLLTSRLQIAFPIGGPMNYPTYTWQELNWHPAYDHRDFFEFCNNVTGYGNTAEAKANATTVDMQLAKYTNGSAWTGLAGYAAYVKDVVVSSCESADLIDSTSCFSTQNRESWLLRPYTCPHMFGFGRPFPPSFPIPCHALSHHLTYPD